MIGIDLNLTLPDTGQTIATNTARTATALAAIEAAFADKVTPAAINVNAPLVMNGNSVTEVGSVVFATGNSSASPGSIYYYGGDFYVVDAVGTIKLTDSGVINSASIGGIVGDYASVGAEVAFSTATASYTFKQGGGSKPWARITGGDLRLYETGTTEAVYVGIKAPASLAASFDVTMPLAAPAQKSPVLMDSSGVLTATGVQTLTLAPGLAAISGGASNGTFANVFSTSGLSNAFYALPLKEGQTITGFSFRLNKLSNATNTLTLDFYKLLDGAYVGGSVINTQTNSANAPGNITLSATGLTTTIGAGEVAVIRISNSNSTASAIDSIYNGKVTFYE